MNFERSPAAEHITREAAKRRGIDIQVSSAGLCDPKYGFMSDYMARAIQRLGYPDPNSHRPRKIDPEILGHPDLIFCFEKRQLELINTALGRNDPRVHTLAGFTGEHRDILSPQAFTRDCILSAAIMHFPTPLRQGLSEKLGYVHRGDTRGIELVHERVAREIEKYVLLALDKITARPS